MLCRKEGIAQSPLLRLVQEVHGGGQAAPCGRYGPAAITDEVKDLRRESMALKEVVAEQASEIRLLKKSMIADGGDEA
jgi:transposase